MDEMRLLVTGGAGFIGSNFIRYILGRHMDWEITNLDKLTYAGNLANLKDVERNKNYRFVKGDICDESVLNRIQDKSKIDCIINFAAETHVDRSIDDPFPFLKTNVFGTMTLLEFARRNKIPKYIQISTDEVYGSLGKEGCFTEKTQISPNSPYSASKAAADHLVQSYFSTYALPALITRCSNNYGPYQFPEKLIPLLITNAYENKMLPIYGDGKNVRDWIHVDDHSSGVEAVLLKGKPGEVYNLGGDCEELNINIAKSICDIMEKPHSIIKFVADRPGHDRRYAMDFSKIKKELGWEPTISLKKQGLKDCVSWYLDNPEWWKQVRSGEYTKYYEKMYGSREILF
jgi:dTDP-glucose 4,6-dehydratase